MTCFADVSVVHDEAYGAHAATGGTERLYSDYQEYSKLVNEVWQTTLRDPPAPRW